MINLSKNFRMMEQMLRDRAEYIHQMFYSAYEDLFKQANETTYFSKVFIKE